MRQEVAAASAQAPYLAGYMDAADLTNSYPYEEMNEYQRYYPQARQAMTETLNYFDCINFADKITCPIIVNIGLNDDVCPPETGYAVFERIGSQEKKLYTYDRHGHDGGNFYHAAIVAKFFEEKLQPSPAPSA
jgi:cephalosporin-C deacetylase